MNTINNKMNTLLSYCSEGECPQKNENEKCAIHRFLCKFEPAIRRECSHEIIDKQLKKMFTDSQPKSETVDALNVSLKEVLLNDYEGRMQYKIEEKPKTRMLLQKDVKLKDFWKSVYNVNEIRYILSLLDLDLKKENEILEEYHISAQVLDIWKERYTPLNDKDHKIPQSVSENDIQDFKKFLPRIVLSLNTA